MNLTFSIKDNILKRMDKNELVSKNRNIYKCIFTFEDEIWLNINKFCIFTDGWGETVTVHLGKNSNKLSCIIPDNILRGSHFKVTVYGGDLLTTNNVNIPLIESGYKPGEHHGCHSNPNSHGGYTGHKDVFVEIFDRLDKNIDNIGFSDNCLHLYNHDNLIESIYLPFADEDQVIGLMQEFRLEFKDSIDELDEKIEEIITQLEEYVRKEDIEFTNDGLLIFN